MPSKLALCPSCDLVSSLPDYEEGYKAVCPRCGQVLRSGYITPLKDVAAVAIAALILLICAITNPFLSVDSLLGKQTMALTSIVKVLRFDWSVLLYVFILSSFIMPAVVLWDIVLLGLFHYKPGRLFCNIYSFCHRFSMVDVFILGVLVSLIKLTSLADVGFYSGFVAAAVFSVLLVYCVSKVRPTRVWDLMMSNEIRYGQTGVQGIKQGLKLCRHCGMVLRSSRRRCPRCHHSANKRDLSCVQKTFALLSAALILYLPSNLYPVMFTTYLGSETGSNIVDGVIALWNMDSYFVALVILFASIFIPVLKIMALSFLLIMVKLKKVKRPRVLSGLYRLIAFIGKWSMIDVFVVIIMSSVVRMSGLLVIDPGFAIIAFCSVVIITMFAAENFDERLIWDNANDTKQ